MIVHELHTDLSRRIGDPIEYNALGGTRAEQLPDGVRYSLSLRDSYLSQAMRDILSSALRQVASLPAEVKGKLLSENFPSMIYDKEVYTTGGGWDNTILAEILLPFSLRADTSDFQGDYVDIALLEPREAVRRGFQQTVQVADPTAGWTSTGFVGRLKEDISDYSSVFVTYICRAPEVADLSSTATVAFEDTWRGLVLNRAAILAQLDSQEQEALQAGQFLQGGA